MLKRCRGLALALGWVAASTWAGAQVPTAPPAAPGAGMAPPGATAPIMSYGAPPAHPVPVAQGAMPGLPAPGFPSGPPPALDCGGGDNGFSPNLACGEPSCAPHVTHFWSEFEWLLWWFKERQLPPLVTIGNINDAIPGALGQPGTHVVFGNSGSDTNPYNGGRLWLGYWFDDDHTCAIEGNAFFLENRVARAILGGNGDAGGSAVVARPFLNVNLGIQDADPIAVPGVLGGHIIITQPRQFFGTEANFRLSQPASQYKLSRWSILAGARYLNLNEKLETNESLFDVPGLGVPGNTYHLDEHFTTYNRFYGGQVGLGWDLNLGSVFLSVDSRVAFGPNHETEKVSGGSSIVEPSGFVALGPNRALLVAPSNVGNSTKNVFSIVPETTVHLGYNFNENVNVTIGYNFLYWHRLAQPNDQLDTAINIQKLQPFDQVGPDRPQRRFEQSNIWVHGLTLSLGISF